MDDSKTMKNNELFIIVMHATRYVSIRSKINDN